MKTESKKILITKVDGDSTRRSIGRKDIGLEVLGKPETGKMYYLQPINDKWTGIRTSVICEILDDNTFRTANSTYRIEEIKGRISINIWDDFWDDGYVPEGKRVETKAYVESETDEELAGKGMKCMYDFISGLSILKGVEVKLSGDRIYFTDLTHKILDGLMEILDKEILVVDGYELDIYSES